MGYVLLGISLMTPVDRAKADLAKMRADLGRLQVQMEMLSDRMRKVESYIEMASFYETDEDAAEAARSRGGGISAIAVRLAVDMLKERGAPMHTREIIKELEAKGVVIGGSNPIANLSGFLSRSEELVNNRAIGWGLAGRDLPAVEYGKGGFQQKLEQIATKLKESRVSEPQAIEPAGWEPSPDNLDDEIPF